MLRCSCSKGKPGLSGDLQNEHKRLLSSPAPGLNPVFPAGTLQRSSMQGSSQLPCTRREMGSAWVPASSRAPKLESKRLPWAKRPLLVALLAVDLQLTRNHRPCVMP